MNIREALLSISAYPIPERTISLVSHKRGMSLDDEASAEVMASRAYRLAIADLYVWLYLAPNVGQGGQSYSLTEKSQLRAMARAIYSQYGDEEGLALCGTRYGYKGSRL